MPLPSPVRIADALVITHCAYTSLKTLHEFGTLERDWRLYSRLAQHFGGVVHVSYGGAEDHAIAAQLGPNVRAICNDQHLEPALFLAGVPGRVATLLANTQSVLVWTDQMWGGEVGLLIARALRAGNGAGERGRRVGLVARCGYHWSRTVAREQGPHSFQAAAASNTEGELCRGADVVVATTRTIADDLAFKHGLDPARIRTVPNFVLCDQAPPSFSWRERGLILTAGRLAREKRTHLLIDAIARLSPPARAVAHLLVYGSGPMENALRTMALALGVSAEFHPRVPHSKLLAEMGRCGVYAQMSEYEGHPKTVLEAMSMGAPVLVAHAPGLSDHVISGHSGIVTAPEPDLIAQSLEGLIADPTAAARLGAAAATRTRAEFDLERITPTIVETAACAMMSAGTAAQPPHSIVRWDQTLLTHDALQSAAAWTGSIHAFARRLSPPARTAFADALTARLSPLIEQKPLPVAVG